MIRITLYYIKLIIAFITALLFTSCNLSFDKIETKHLNGTSVIEEISLSSLFNNTKTVSHNGDVIKKEVFVANHFNKIKVSNAMDVVINQGNETKIWVEAHENLHEHIILDFDNETLVIKKNKNFNSGSINTVYVTIPELEKIKASSASTVKFVNEMKVNELDIEASSAAEINLNIIAKELSAKASSASKINIAGKVVDLEIKSSSASTVNASKLTSKDAEVDASSAATIKVTALNNLKIDASSGANIIYYKPTNNVEIKTSSGGTIKAY